MGLRDVTAGLRRDTSVAHFSCVSPPLSLYIDISLCMSHVYRCTYPERSPRGYQLFENVNRRSRASKQGRSRLARALHLTPHKSEVGDAFKATLYMIDKR